MKTYGGAVEQLHVFFNVSTRWRWFARYRFCNFSRQLLNISWYIHECSVWLSVFGHHWQVIEFPVWTKEASHVLIRGLLPPEVLVDDGVCRYTADVTLVGYICDINSSVLLNHSTNSFNIVRRSWSGLTARAVFINDVCSATLETFHPLINLEFSPYCAKVFLWILEGFIPSDHSSRMSALCSTVVQSEIGAMFTLLGM